MTEKEIHPIKAGFVPVGTKVLIVGTFPPKREYVKKKDGFFFYSSEKNQFWNRIDNIFPKNKSLKKTKTKNNAESFVDNRKRKEVFAKQMKIGFLDVYTEIKRKKSSSEDVDLVSIETIMQNGTLQNVLGANKIDRICCTYTLAYERLKCSLSLMGYTVEQKESDSTANGEILEISKDNKKSFDVVLLYPATRSGHKGQIKDAQYKKFLFEGV